ncbi:hypothetical protein FOA52_007628 [Chlamydomonas sp. UWO 241]|nr:hypothetical protein FOA52_007628 [Chlamydomonas sp. UWO 241]
MDDWDYVKSLLHDLRVSLPQPQPSPTQCAHADVFLDEGNYVCRECRSLVYRHIDHAAEWRFFGGRDDAKGGAADPTRCGMPANDLMPGSALGAIIGVGGGDSYSTRVMRRYHMWNSMTYKERTLYGIFDNLQTIANNNGIPKAIVDEAKILYKNVSETKITRGDNRAGIIAASIYMACKMHDVPRSASEIAKAFKIKDCTMTRGCKRFQELAKMSVNTTRTGDFINRFCSKLDLGPGQRAVCHRMVDLADQLGIVSDNTPPSVAAGVILVCSALHDWRVTKKMLADVCGVSQVTIGKCAKKIELYKSHLVA